VPLAGEISEVNTQAVEDPAAVNEDPYGDGWLVKLKLASDDIGELLDAAAYEAYVKEESEKA